MAARLIGSSAEHHPPLRPLAPEPTVAASRTTIRQSGRRSARYHAVHSPVSPPPTITTSASTSPASTGRSADATPSLHNGAADVALDTVTPSAPGEGLEHDVVDQADLTEPDRSAQHRRAGDDVDGFERD